MEKKFAKGTILNMIDFMMAQVGITREQATIAIETIVNHMQQTPGDPLHKIVTAMFGTNDDSKTPLN